MFHLITKVVPSRHCCFLLCLIVCRKLPMRRIQWTVEDLDFADDLCLLLYWLVDAKDKGEN